MKHELRDSNYKRIDSLSESEFQLIAETRMRLLSAMLIEETFDNVFNNFLEIEKTMVTYAIDHSYNRFTAYEELHRWRSEATRIVANYLSASRTYLDHTAKALSDISEFSEANKCFKFLCHQEYDASLSYRLAETMRNVAQHSSSVVSGMCYPSNIDQDEDLVRHVYSAYPTIGKKELLKSSIKGKVKAEIASLDHKSFDVQSICRGHMDGICNIHRELRLQLKRRLSEDDRLLPSLAAAHNNDLLNKGVIAIKMAPDNTFEEENPLLIRFSDRRSHYEKLNDLSYCMRYRCVYNKSSAEY